MPFNIGGVQTPIPILLGAGAAKNPNKAAEYLQPNVPLGVVVSGSYTLNSHAGNTGKLMWPEDLGTFLRHGFGLNAWGMPNMGLREAMPLFPQNPTKPHIISIAGFKASEYVEMMSISNENGHIAGREINAGCPNTGHLPVAYDLDELRRLLDVVLELHDGGPLWLKLSPYMTAQELGEFAKRHPQLNFSNTPTVEESFVEQLCELLGEFSAYVHAVVMSNTLPNVIYGDSITVKNADGTVHHKGGLSGPILRVHNLKLIKQMGDLGLTKRMDIIGCGGATTGDEVMEYINAGCVGVACTSGPSWSNPKFFQELLEGSPKLQDYIARHNEDS